MTLISVVPSKGDPCQTTGSITCELGDLPALVTETIIIEVAVKLIDQAEKLLIEHLKGKGLYDLVESGAGKGWEQPRQILIAKGIIADPTGKVLDPISTSFSEGLQPKEYFDASSGSRKGIMDRVINTADTGYMARKLAYLLNTVEADRQLRDCGVKKYLNIKLNSNIIEKLYGRFIMHKGKLVEFDEKIFKVGDIINLRTPIYCQSSKICHTCYGRLLERHKTPYIGILAAQMIGERGTQTIMKSFHTGGAVNIAQNDVLRDLVENDPLANLNKAELAKYLEQTDDKVTTKKSCKVVIDLMNYREKDS